MNKECEHYWVKGSLTGETRCVKCGIPQNTDAKSCHIDNRNSSMW